MRRTFLLLRVVCVNRDRIRQPRPQHDSKTNLVQCAKLGLDVGQHRQGHLASRLGALSNIEVLPDLARDPGVVRPQRAMSRRIKLSCGVVSVGGEVLSQTAGTYRAANNQQRPVHSRRPLLGR